MNLTERLATRAATIRPARVVLTVLASPLFLVGFLAGVLFVAAVWMAAGIAEGFAAGRDVLPSAGQATE